MSRVWFFCGNQRNKKNWWMYQKVEHFSTLFWPFLCYCIKVENYCTLPWFNNIQSKLKCCWVDKQTCRSTNLHSLRKKYCNKILTKTLFVANMCSWVGIAKMHQIADEMICYQLSKQSFSSQVLQWAIYQSMDFSRSHLIIYAPMSVDHFQSSLLDGFPVAQIHTLE